MSPSLLHRVESNGDDATAGAGANPARASARSLSFRRRRIVALARPLAGDKKMIPVAVRRPRGGPGHRGTSSRVFSRTDTPSGVSDFGRRSSCARGGSRAGSRIRRRSGPSRGARLLLDLAPTALLRFLSVPYATLRPPDLKPFGAYCCWDFVPVRQGLINFLAPNSPCTAALAMCTLLPPFRSNPAALDASFAVLSSVDSHPSGSPKRSFIVTGRLMVRVGVGYGRRRGASA